MIIGEKEKSDNEGYEKVRLLRKDKKRERKKNMEVKKVENNEKKEKNNEWYGKKYI